VEGGYLGFAVPGAGLASIFDRDESAPAALAGTPGPGRDLKGGPNMEEGTSTALLAEGQLDEEIVERATSASREAPLDERVIAGLEAVVDVAEIDPAATRSALSSLRTDPRMLAQLEGCLELGPERATLALGGALQLALSELASSEPDLRMRIPEMERWLKGGW
jgi:hypothetical protein